MNSCAYLIRQAWASLLLRKGFGATVIITMGTTLGALLCALTLAYLLIFQPFPYPDQERLYVAEHGFINANKEHTGYDFSYPGLVHLYKSKEAFEQAAMLLPGQGVITSQSSLPLVNTAYVTPEFHHLLDSPIILGRLFDAREALNTNNPAAILSYKIWLEEFDADEGILEQTINLSGVSYKVIGVLAEDFFEPELAQTGRETQIWLPWDFNPTDEVRRQRFGSTNRNYRFLGLLKEGMNQAQAQQVLTSLVNSRWQEGVADIEFFKGWSIEMRVRSIKVAILGSSQSIAILLLAGIIGLVLIACVNMSNLFLSRTAEKQRQMSIQAAIGATKKHLFKATFAEIILLMFLSTILALVFAKFGFYILQHYLNTVLPRAGELSLNLMTFGSALAAVLALALLFAKISTQIISYHDLNIKLQSSNKGSGLQVSKKTRQLLIISQVALATVLVCANASILNNALGTINTPLGFQTDNISTLEVSYSSAEDMSVVEAIAITQEMMEEIEALPQVMSLSQSSTPLERFGILTVTNLLDNERYSPRSKSIDERYFDTIEQTLLRGDNFTVEDRLERANVMIVNQAFAKQLEPNGNVLGLQVSVTQTDHYKIIGVVEDIAIPGDITEENEHLGVPRVYRPNRLYTWNFMLKLEPGTSVNRQDLGQLISDVDSRFSVFNLRDASDILNQHLFAEITTLITTVVLASLVLMLAGIGLYGIFSYSIQLRKFELGTRSAIGAKRSHMVSLIMGDNIKVVSIGIIGSLLLLTIFYLSDYIQPFFTLQTLPVILVSLGLIVSVTILACYWPLRKYINNPAIHLLKGNDS
jgi:predicted permease